MGKLLSHALILLISFSAGLAAQSKPAVAPNFERTPIEWLKTAEISSRGFSPEERADALLDIAEASEKLDPKASIGWSIELLHAAHKLPAGQNRAALEKDALVNLARIDPEQAAALYREQDAVGEWAAGKVPNEDIRADGTRVLFPALWKSQSIKALPEIESIAEWLGDTGAYPYSGVSAIFKEVNSSNEDAARELFLEAVEYLPKGQAILSTNPDFVRFLLSTWKIVPSSLSRIALQRGVAQIQEAAADDTKPHYVGQATSGQATMTFNSQGEFLIYRLLPVAREVDPDLAKKILEEHPALRNSPAPADDQPSHFAGVLSSSDASPESIRATLDQSRLFQVQQMAEADPKQAFAIATEISSPSVRQTALASLAPFYAKVDSSRATSWMKDAASQLDKMEPGIVKLRLMAALARSWFTERREKQALQMTGDALDLGEELFSQYMLANPGAMAYSAEGFDELTSLVKNATLHAEVPAEVFARVRQVHDDVLRVRLTVMAAEGLSERKNIKS